MKKYTIILIIIISQLSFSQNTINEVIYKKKVNVIFKKKVDKKIADLYEEATKKSEKTKYKLQFNKSISFFEKIESLEKEEMSYASLLANSFGLEPGKYYIDTSRDSVVNQKNFRTDLFRITSKLSDKNWKIDFDTSKKIGNYTCYKATGIKKILMPGGNMKSFPVTAWFATELPYPFGPADCGGLPGLILEIHIKSTIIYADKITLNKKLIKKEKGIKPLKKGILLSSEDYIKMQKSGGVYKRPKR